MVQAGHGKLSDRSPWWVALISLLLADLVYGFQQSAITPALPLVKKEFAASQEWTTWIFSGYLIVATVMPIFGGKLADRIGRRRVFLAALTVFLIGSVTAGTAPSTGVVVIGRLIQGVGGIVFPLSFAILRDSVGRRWLSKGIGILTGGFGLGSLAGFGFGGVIAQFAGWRWIFFIGALALILGIVLVWITVPVRAAGQAVGLDTFGAVLLGCLIATLIIALTEGSRQGWASSPVIALYLVALVAGVLWVWHERRTAQPMMDLRVLTSRAVLFTNIASFLGGYAVFSLNVLLPFLIQSAPVSGHLTAFGISAGPLLTGIILIPRALGQSVGGPISGPLAQRITPAVVLSIGMLVQSAGAVGLAFWRSHAWMLLTELAAVGIGFGVAISAAASIVTLAARGSQSGTASSLNSVLRRFGGGIGAQSLTAIIASITTRSGSAPAPAAFTSAFTIVAGVSVLAAGCAWLAVPRRSPRTAPRAG